MPDRHAGTASGLERVASLVQRLAVLLAAGVAPGAAWGYLAEDASDGILHAVADDASRGVPIAESLVAFIGDESQLASPSSTRALPGEAPGVQAWRGLAAAWQVATEAGASLAPSLRQFAGSLRDLAQTQRDLSVALAGPVATARMVMVLPIIGVLFGLALGFDTLGTLFTTVPGWACLVLGVVLMVGARLWNRRLVARAQPSILTPGLGLDLMAIAVSGGASLVRASAAVKVARESCGLASADDETAVIESVLSLSRRAGVPAAELLRSEAEEVRRRVRSEGQRAAATLAVTLMLPLGLCILPAFMLLGVAPLIISIITSTVGLV
ncbi:type II secretion system F family protein [Parafrigoribacterium soli]|uniref:type II secretion system F family protein n=1 Tax=Parafrigoribacterium soli TaxID=3144663 RepID=UPI0032EE7C1F